MVRKSNEHLSGWSEDKTMREEFVESELAREKANCRDGSLCGANQPKGS